MPRLRERFQSMHLRKILESIQLPLILFNCHRQRISFANTAAQDLLGYPKEQILRIPFKELFPPNAQGPFESICSLLSHNEAHLREEKIRMKRKSGRAITVNLEAQSVPLLQAGHFLITLHDITEIEELHERQKNSVQQLAHLSKLADIGSLSAGVAHEVNNPLATIKLCLETMEYILQDKGLLDEKFANQFGIANTSIDRISKLTHQMAKLAKEDELKFQDVELSDLVKKIVKFYSPKLAVSRVEVNEEYSGQCWIEGDNSKIEQALINILNNAIYAISNSNESPALKVKVWSSGAGCHVEVWNSGDPIPNEIQSKIFAPFFTGKPVGTGIGMGLSISYNILKSHGGDIQFQSSAGKGTRFVLTFPEAAKAAA